jgi:hypothetical protein
VATAVCEEKKEILGFQPAGREPFIPPGREPGDPTWVTGRPGGLQYRPGRPDTDSRATWCAPVRSRSTRHG